ncbi:hypothetical protein [Nocardia stercoris]|uniref:hypothetical protein n=1 Tax=Nocardia stercoris TaxID=2483361 RepID=UPI001F45DEAD|nr:hypothetical protein [Nocardia stercoris]
MELHRNIRLSSTRVDAGPGATVRGANRGRQLEFHVVGPGGVTHYEGESPPAERTSALDVGVVAAAGDGTKVSRVYVAERDSDRLLAVDEQSDNESLRVVGSAALGEPIRYLATDDTRIYAVTEQRVTVLETRSFEGYTAGVIPVIRTFDFRAALPEGPARSAPVSGIAAGNDRVFVTVSGQPYVVAVAKPRL